MSHLQVARCQYCCETMAASVDSFPELRLSEWRNSLILYEPAEDEYGLPIRLADEFAYEPIRYCPWCGNDLTPTRSHTS